MGRLLAPLSWRFRCAIPALVAAVLGCVRLVGWAFASATPSAPAAGHTGDPAGEEAGSGGVVGEFGVAFLVLVTLASLGGFLMPDSGITPDFRDEWDR